MYPVMFLATAINYLYRISSIYIYTIHSMVNKTVQLLNCVVNVRAYK